MKFYKYVPLISRHNHLRASFAVLVWGKGKRGVQFLLCRRWITFLCHREAIDQDSFVVLQTDSWHECCTQQFVSESQIALQSVQRGGCDRVLGLNFDTDRHTHTHTSVQCKALASPLTQERIEQDICIDIHSVYWKSWWFFPSPNGIVQQT